MADFFLTFGVQYASEPHPVLAPENCHPDGYGVVHAATYEDARRMVFERVGSAWSMLYTAEEFNASYHPRGALFHIGTPDEAVAS